MDTSSIENLYKDYGYEIIKDYDDILIFLYKKGRYFGVDIIPLNDSLKVVEKSKEVQESYSNLGFAVNLKECNSKINEIEIELFKSFFSYDSTLARLSRKYTEFSAKQTKNLLGNEYVYIESPYEIYNGLYADQKEGLLETVYSILNRTDPQLVIIEAAAGYGKTCAAYEILNKLTVQSKTVISPLFTELSKNRGAKIFRYILLDEIDVEFPTLNSDLVIHEIKNGRIPLIIDGFDELLDKVNVSNIDITKAFDEIESMLDTIGSLLEYKAKIILTTRKTAIFSGLEFDKWYQKWNNKFHVTRLSLKEPRIKDWVGVERFGLIKEFHTPIQYLANPVILTYLRNIPIEDFKTQLSNPDLLVKQYFEKMLERERERQNLIITVDKQYEIFKNVAKMLLEFDITVESKNFFKEIIKDQNYKLLEYTRTLYAGQNKPSVENLIDTLATHALLDRKGRDQSQIGFINDFVLGILIGEIICDTSIEKIEKDYSYYMLDLACTAFKVQNRKNKAVLWEKVNSVSHKLQPYSIFNYDITLKEALVREYSDLSIYDLAFFNITFDQFSISNSVFLNCYFKGCYFDPKILKGVSFIDCTFDNCSVVNGEYLDSSKDIASIKSKLKECQILENYKYHAVAEDHIFNDVETMILKRLMSISTSKAHHIMQLLQFFDKAKQKLIVRSLDDLIAREFIEIRGNHIYFNINKLNIIKTELSN